MRSQYEEKVYPGNAPGLIREMLNDTADRLGDKAAFVQREDGEYRPYSFRRYRSDAAALATALAGRGLAGKHIVLAGNNCYAWALCYMAVVSGVGVVVPVDKSLSAEELGQLICRSDAAAVLCSDEVAARLAGQGTIPVLAFSELPALIDEGRAAINRGAENAFDTELDPNAPAVLVFTSGAADRSRGVVFSNANITYGLIQSAALLEVDGGDTFFSVLPLHHAFECTLGFLNAIRLGATVAFCDDLGRMREDMSEMSPTVLIGVPWLIEKLYLRLREELAENGRAKTADKVRAGRLSATGLVLSVKKRLFAPVHRLLGGRMRLFVSVGARIDPEVLSGLNALGFRAVQGYGHAECVPLIAVNPVRAPRIGSVGVGLPDGTVDIYNKQEDGTGEIRYKGKNVMLGYYNMPEPTAKAKRDGWLYTGDMGYLDEDGYLYVTGRKKNAIVTAAGKIVNPEELEEQLSKDPFVREAVVVGFIDGEKKDYDLVAVIHPDYEAFREAFGDNFTLSDVERELDRAFAEVNDAVRPYKRMEMYLIREQAFEKTASQRIRRRDVAPSVIESYRRKKHCI